MARVAEFLAIALLALPAASGAVSLDPISQDREVAVEIQVRTDTCPPPSEPPNGCYEPGNPPTSTAFDDYADIESAPDFGPFVATAMDPAFSDTSTWQSSSISPSALLASGTWASWADASLSFIGPPLELLQVTERHVNQNRYEVTFELSQTAAFSLTGALELLVWGEVGNASIELVGPGGTRVTGIDLDLDSVECYLNLGEVCEASLSESGLLAPGVYTLRAFGGSVAQSFIGSHSDGSEGSFDVELLIEPPPVPALPPGGAVLLGGALVAAVGAARRLPARRGSGHRRHSRSVN
jgi:hypothetical protein